MRAHEWPKMLCAGLALAAMLGTFPGRPLKSPTEKVRAHVAPSDQIARGLLPYEAGPTPTHSQPQGQIAFHSVCDGSADVFVMESDGTEVLNLTHSLNVGEGSPAWSPDGEWIAFDRGSFPPVLGLEEIYVMKADGTELTRLTRNEVSDMSPSWSPDGQWIAFVSSGEICKMRADGSEVTRLTSTELQGCGPSWSPDGQWIAFQSTFDFNSDIYKMRTDGSELTRLTRDEASAYCPSWSPDGRRLAFTSIRDGNNEIYLVDDDGSNRIRLTYTPDDEFCPEWSPDGSWLAFTYLYWIPGDIEPADVTEIHALRVADGERRVLFSACPDARVLCDAGGPSWQPIPHGDTADLLDTKRSWIFSLSSPTFDFLGIPMPSAGYDEGASSELLTRLEEGQGSGHLTISEVSALQRLVLMEEALVELYPHYALAADDTADGTLSLLLIGLGFVKAFQEVDRNLAETPFSAVAKQLLVRISAKVIDLLNTFFTWAERSISDPYWRETVHMMRDGLWRAAQVYLMAAQEPFVDRGMTFLNAFSDVTLKPVAMRMLLDRYVGQTQPIIDRAVHTADPEYIGSDRNEVQPSDERAHLQMEGVIDRVGIWSEYHHETYEHFKETADLPGTVGDLADIASMTGILAPIGQVVARASDVMEGLLVGYGSVKSWQFLQCLESQALDAEARIYDPSLPGGEFTGPCERAHRLGLFSLRDDEDRGVVLDREVKARVEGELAEYGALVESVLEALEEEDEEGLVVLIEQLLEGDEALAEELGILDVALAAGDPEKSMDLYSQEVEFQLQSIVFYASLIDTLMASGDEAELKQQAVTEGEELLDALVSYEVRVEALPEAVETGEEAGTALLAIRSVNVPEMTVGEEVSIQVEVRNVGSATSEEVSLMVTDGEHVRITEEKVHVGEVDEGQEEEVVFRGQGVSEGTEILMVELYEGERYVTAEMVLAEVSAGRDAVVPTHLALAPWMALLCGVIGLIPLILGSGIGVWLWSKASRGVQRCPHCGADNAPGNRFCIRCGEGLEEQ
ncbi:MAG TPA: zinc-ribbon domain-containing protein [Anaerolineae bacterium]|nr:zinc-ribbon domain-containing protein [Anaerolineae bacterium]